MITSITFLGTGTSQGVPIIGCQCNVCKSNNLKDKRLRSSVLIEHQETKIVVDTGPDFRQQMLREEINNIDAVVYTHSHKDHLAGLDDIRAFNYIQQKAIDVYAREDCWARIKKEFDYVFATEKYPGVPLINEHIISEKHAFYIQHVEVIPILVWHYKMPVLGYRIGDITYITDANRIDSEEFKKIEGSKLLIINALQKTAHVSHFTLQEAIAIAKRINAPQTYFTHISHRLGLSDEVENELPLGINLAYDGLKINI